MRRIRAAAVQLKAELGAVEANLERAAGFVREAFRQGANYVVLPEFFTTGMTFDDEMLESHLPLEGAAMQMLKDLAVEGGGTVGGSFLAEADGHVFNTFALVQSDGVVSTHARTFRQGQSNMHTTLAAKMRRSSRCWRRKA